MDPKTIVLAIVTVTDDISLACTTSLLRLQQMAGRRTDCRLDVHVVPSFLEALNLYASGDYVVVMDAMAGVPPEFVFGVLDAPHPVIAGVYPLPTVDWERVGKVLRDPESTEPIGHAGNVYNLVPASGSLKRYVPVSSVTELKILAVQSTLLEQLAGPDISYVDPVTNKPRYLFAHESVFKDAYQNAYQTFSRRLPCAIVADLDAPCVLSAPAQFAGCVGMRRVLR